MCARERTEIMRYGNVMSAALVCLAVSWSSPVICASTVADKKAEDTLAITEACRGDNEILQAGEKREFKVEVQNTGSTTIKIAKILLTNCGCGGASIKPKTLDAGQIGIVSYSPNTHGLTLGRYGIRLSALKADGKVVDVEGEANYTIQRNVLVTPTMILLGTKPTGYPFEATIRVSVRGEDVPGNIAVRSSLPGVVGKIDPGVIRTMSARDSGVVEMQEFGITISGHVPMKPGEIREEIDIILEDYKGADRLFEIPLTGRIPMDVEVMPNPVMLGYISAGQTVKRRITLLHETDRVLKLDSIEAPDWMSIQYFGGADAEGHMPVDLLVEVGAPKQSGGAEVVKLNGTIAGKPFTVDITALYVSAATHSAVPKESNMR
jgi:hypothetical protein